LNYRKTKTLLTHEIIPRKSRLNNLKCPLTFGKKRLILGLCSNYIVQEKILYKKKWKSKNIPQTLVVLFFLRVRE
jgi:hypothetical protein